MRGRRPRLQGPLYASQVVTPSDHAELEAEVSGTVVNRITFDGDRIAQVSRAPDGFPPNAAHAPGAGAVVLGAWRRSVSVATPTT